jgi:16S rRNA (guanine527-N7)-methyltransferase
MSTALNELLATALQENGYSFSPATQQQFIHFLDLLQQWNRVFNLTALDSPQQLVYLHILDSLSISPHLQGQRMLDVGSGGGLPGLPLAIANPQQNWVLLDKTQKKTRFLVQVVAALGLKNVTVVCARCEAFRSATGFDSIVSRAFGTIALLLTSTQHLIRPEGQFLAMKGNYPEQELTELPTDFAVSSIEKLRIYGLDAARHLVRLKRKDHDKNHSHS